MNLPLFRAHHAVPTVILRFQTLELVAPVVTFSGDTGRLEALLETAHDADLFVCEATCISVVSEAFDDHGRLAGQTAQEAGVGHLVVTHFSTDDIREAARAQADPVFDGRVSITYRGGWASSLVNLLEVA